MKRFTVAILAVLYFTISSGMIVSVHYCMNRVSSVNVDVIAKGGCNICGKKTKGCCRTEIKVFKTSSAHQAAYSDISIHAPLHCLPVNSNLIDPQIAYLNNATISDEAHSPPPLSRPIYLTNRVLRI